MEFHCLEIYLQLNQDFEIEPPSSNKSRHKETKIDRANIDPRSTWLSNLFSLFYDTLIWIIMKSVLRGEKYGNFG